MIDIWFEAHAQTYHNAAGLASGHYDVALTEQGRRRADRLADALRWPALRCGIYV